MMGYLKQLYKVWVSPGNRHARLQALFRAFHWFTAKRIPSAEPPTIKIFSDRLFVCHLDGFISNSVMLFSEWSEYDSLKFIDSFLRPGDNFLDVGTNVGLFTLLASRHVGTGNLVCVEPGRLQRQRLMNHLDINQIKAEVFEYAVGDEEKSASFSNGDAVAHIMPAQDAGPQETEMVEVRRLDSFIQDRKYHFMKLDVEGFEMPALTGALHLISSGKLPVILFELNGGGDHYGITSDKVPSFLRDNGYILGIYHHDSRTFDTTARLWDDVLALNTEGMQMLRERIPEIRIL